jgi:TPR repeat protein
MAPPHRPSARTVARLSALGAALLLVHGAHAEAAQVTATATAPAADGAGVGLYQKMCEMGGALECVLAGDAYDEGSGVARDPARAAHFYTLACDRGVATGCASLGVLYERGTGVARDIARAAALYQRGCDGDAPGGCVHLARMHETGAGAARDAARAKALYARGCGGKGAVACWDLGYRAERGTDAPADLGFAVSLYRASCEGGDARGCDALAWLTETGSGVAKDLTAAAALYQRGCDGGHGFGCERLADFYAHGTTVAADLARAAALYGKACDGGLGYACAGLADLYTAGSGVAKDEARAAALYKTACEGGVSWACSERERSRRRRQRAPGLEAWTIDSLRPAALYLREGTRGAYLTNSSGDFWPAKAGQALLDGTITSVTPDAVSFRRKTGALVTRRMFEKGEPPRLVFDPKYGGAAMSLDLDGDVGNLAAIMADVSGLNIIVDAGSRAPVHLAAREAPWDGLLSRALSDAGFVYRIGGTIAMLAKADRIDHLPLPAPATWSGKPISLRLRDADMKDLATVFAELSGRKVTLPEGSCDSVNVYFEEVMWDEALAWIVASCGWTSQTDATTIRIEAAARK